MSMAVFCVQNIWDKRVHWLCSVCRICQSVEYSGCVLCAQYVSEESTLAVLCVHITFYAMYKLYTCHRSASTGTGVEWLLSYEYRVGLRLESNCIKHMWTASGMTMAVVAMTELPIKLTMAMMTGWCVVVCVQEVLQQLLIWRLPNIQAICREPDKGLCAPAFGLVHRRSLSVSCVSALCQYQCLWMWRCLVSVGNNQTQMTNKHSDRGSKELEPRSCEPVSVGMSVLVVSVSMYFTESAVLYLLLLWALKW